MKFDSLEDFHKELMVLQGASEPSSFKLPVQVNLLGTKEVATRIFAYLQKSNITVSSVFSYNEEEQGKLFNGYKIIKPTANGNLTIICSYNYDKIEVFDPEMEVISWVEFLFKCETQGLLPWNCLTFNKTYFLDNWPAVEQIYYKCIDSASKAEFLMQMWARIQPNVVREKISKSQEFCESRFVELNESSVILDCGAFDGDTAQRFLKTYGNHYGPSVICIEPDLLSMAKLVDKFKSDSRVKFLNAFLGAEKKVSKFSLTGEVTSSINSKIENANLPIALINTTLIDSIASIYEIDFVKMDIEGAEITALSGARNLINDKKTTFAISVYHLPNDLLEIPSFFMNGYQFGFAAYAQRPWDSVFYAIPE